MAERSSTTNELAVQAEQPSNLVTGRALRRDKNQTTSSNHVLRKRPPICFPKRKKDIYVTNRTNFKAQLNRCEKLLDSGEPELIIHGLGAAINRACNLALQLQNNHSGTLGLDINTSTVDLIDDLQPLDDEGDYEVTSRQNSSIHIRIYRIASIGMLKFAK